ncbi:MAG: D-aminoacyl-tRNA deacylase [bacterium]
MRAVLQRVSMARVQVAGETVGEIADGLLIFLGVGGGDDEAAANYLAEKIANMRIFEDDAGKMNKSLIDIAGGALVISQFTLYGDARRGRRPSFSNAAPLDIAENLYKYFSEKLAIYIPTVKNGIFGAEMKISLVNEGPVTILLDSSKNF